VPATANPNSDAVEHRAARINEDHDWEDNTPDDYL